MSVEESEKVHNLKADWRSAEWQEEVVQKVSGGISLAGLFAAIPSLAAVSATGAVPLGMAAPLVGLAVKEVAMMPVLKYMDLNTEEAKTEYTAALNAQEIAKVSVPGKTPAEAVPNKNSTYIV